MKFLSRFWHFIGSVRFALVLITLSLVFVVVGTWIEGCTGSHSCAAHYTYSSPLFAALLWGYFVNILVSALRRWPFKTTHIPFLMTHLGLLMLIGGVLIKIYFGTQGSMGLVEGQGSNSIFITPSEALFVEAQSGQIVAPLFTEGSIGPLNYAIKEKSLHSNARWTSWIKDSHLSLRGLPLIPLESPPIPLAAQAPWHVIATTKKFDEVYAHHARFNISNATTGNTIAEIQLKDLLNDGYRYNEYVFSGRRENMTLQISILNENTQYNEAVEFSLDSPLPTPYPSREEIFIPRRFLTGIKSTPLIVFHQIEKDFPSISLINSQGEISHLNENEIALFAYDHGFGGYSAIIESSWPAEPKYEAIRWNEVQSAIQDSLNVGIPLAPPLQLLQSLPGNLPENFAQLMKTWLSTGTWLSHALPYANDVDWSKAPPADYKRWKGQALLFQLLQSAAERGENVMESLSKVLSVKITDNKQLVNTLLHYSDHLAEALPTAHPDNSFILSAAFRDQGIHPELFIENLTTPQSTVPVKLETKLRLDVTQESPLTKWEDNKPSLLVNFQEGTLQESTRLSFDKYGTQLKVPILNGKYLVRYQSEIKKIPYRIRLHEARQINYPGTNQPFSYEADVTISNGAFSERSTISMNNVYETYDGYRFYLANLQSGNRQDLQQVQIVVNRDPAKYILTMPGFFILLLGTFSLLLRFRGK